MRGSREDLDDMPEEEDCFGTFDAEDPECSTCGRKAECTDGTPSCDPEEEAPAVEEEAPAEEKPAKEQQFIYTCNKCNGGFDDPKEIDDDGIDDSECPLCGVRNWF